MKFFDFIFYYYYFIEKIEYHNDQSFKNNNNKVRKNINTKKMNYYLNPIIHITSHYSSSPSWSFSLSTMIIFHYYSVLLLKLVIVRIYNNFFDVKKFLK